MKPTVIGPSSIPLMEPEAVEVAPALAVLSTLANMQDPRCAEQAEAEQDEARLDAWMQRALEVLDVETLLRTE